VENVEICEVDDHTLGFLVVETLLQGSLVLCPLGKHKYIHFTYLPRCYHCGVPYVVGFLSCSFLFLPNIAYSSWLANCSLIVGSSEKVDNLWSNPEYEDTSGMLTSPPSISASELFFPSCYPRAPTGCEVLCYPLEIQW